MYLYEITVFLHKQTTTTVFCHVSCHVFLSAVPGFSMFIFMPSHHAKVRYVCLLKLVHPAGTAFVKRKTKQNMDDGEGDEEGKEKVAD